MENIFVFITLMELFGYRGYEDVDWDSKLPPRHEPPTSSLEKMADPVRQCFVLKRYHSRPELWQVSLMH